MDLRAVNSVEVDVAARTVHVAGGATMSDLCRRPRIAVQATA